MNIADYFKKQPDNPIDALIEEQQNDDIPVKKPNEKNETETIIDNILNAENNKSDIYLVA